MAIVGAPGWMGSSAVAETGQNWMLNAAGVVRQGSPFWMSWLGGKSRQHFEIVVGSYVPNTNTHYYGYGTNAATTVSAFGAIQNGNWPGYNCSGFFAASDQGIIVLDGGPDRSWTIQFLDGTRYDFYRDGSVNGRARYRCTYGRGFRDYLANRVNQTLGVVVL